MQSRFRDWSDARIFLAVARKGSTLAASRELDITQTTVSRRIDALEHCLGLTLFERDTRGFHLTPEGAALVVPAEALESAAQSLDKVAKAQRQSLARPIRFTAVDHAMNLELADVFAEFTAENPGTTFEFVVSERPLDLIAGEADVALRLTNRISDDRLICRRVGTAFWTFYASHRYAATHDLPKHHGDDMIDNTVVMLRHIPSNRPNLLRCDSAADLMMAIRSGRGIGPIPTLQGDRDPGLVRCFPPPPNAEFTVWLLTSPAAHRRPEVRRFTAFAGPRFATYLKAQEVDPAAD